MAPGRLPTRFNSLLTDTGPLATLVNPTDQYHIQTKAVMEGLPQGVVLLTTYPCLVETFYLLSHRRNRHQQNEIIERCRSGQIELHHPDRAEFQNILNLMQRYQDNPMSIADASLVAAAEILGLNTVFTYDSDFRHYLLPDNTALRMYSQDSLPL